jgi:nucleoside-diphosphate-sugar epimerase
LRVLVTGATGFVGRWAAKALSARGAEVFCLLRNASRPAEIGHTIVADLLDGGSVRKVVTDIRPNAVLHVAWDVSHGKFYQAAVNLDWLAASIQLARVAADAGVSRIVGVGTCVEYAAPEEEDCDEQTTPVQPTTLYGISKDAVRRVIAGYAPQAGFSFAWARLFHMYGPFEDQRRLVPSVCVRLAQGAPVEISSGSVLRDFMDVRDVGEALAMLTLSKVTGGVNIGSGRAVRVADIAGQLADIAGRADLIRHGALPGRSNEAPRIVATTRRLNHEVGYSPSRPLLESLAETYAWWRCRTASVA